MKKFLGLCLLLIASYSSFAQPLFTLDSCRNMALENNKKLRIANEGIKAAQYNKKSAFANYLPELSVTGSYLYNSKDIRLVSDEQIASIGQSLSGVGQAVTGLFPNMTPEQGAILQGLSGTLGELPGKIQDATTFDIQNVYMGTVSITQPIFTGGKIMAYHKITQFAEDLAQSMRDTQVKDLIVNVDQAYWQVISLVHKEKMAESYLELLQKLTQDVQNMYEVGIATKSDELTVAVKLNEAQIALTKVSDGLTLSKMLLAQLCGMPISADFNLIDENLEVTPLDAQMPENIENVFANRHEIKSLELASKIYKKKEVIARSAMLPQVALMGNYLISNPNLYNGFQNKFSGMFSVGVGVTMPIWNWGKDYYKVRAAKSDTRASIYKLDEAKEMINLQVNQAVFRVNEANKTLLMTITNMNKAEENLNNAQYGYQEGVLTTQNVLEAQTAWLKAKSEQIDAQIGIKLSEVYLSKAIGKNF